MKKITFGFLLLCSAMGFAQNFTQSFLTPNNTFNYPYDMVYGPDNYLWLTERAGKKVNRVNPNTGAVDLLINLGSTVYQTGGQDGLLGIILHPQLGQNSGNDYVYLSYTYSINGQDSGRRERIVRYTYTIVGNDGSLSSPLVLIEGLQASNDHNSAKFAIGPDMKLYYTIGDQGKNQFDNKCLTIRSQDLPTQSEVNSSDYTKYQGKILRMNLDGSIPTDNPVMINGVKSHIYTYGHRNPQGIVFGASGILYSSEHGPKSDDEINIITAGKNYGWPRVSGYNDDKAYAYCNWSTAPNCANLSFSDYTCGTGATSTAESTFSSSDFQEPVKTFFTVNTGYDFSGGYLTWPTIAPSSLKVYEGYSCPIPGWEKSLLSTSLKNGRMYRDKLSVDGLTTEGTTQELFVSSNRLRCVAISPDGRTFYVITDSGGQTSGPTGAGVNVPNPGVIIKYVYIPEDVPVAAAATNVYENEFTANWEPLCSNPTSYRLDVSTSPTFIGNAASLVEWRFNTNSTTATSGTNGNGSKIIATNTGGTISYTTGVTTSAYTSTGWNSGSGSKNFNVEFSTLGQYDLKVSSAQQSSNTGPRNFKIQYRVGTGTWTDLPGATSIVVANNFTSGVVNAVSLPDACENQSSVSLRWIMTSNTSANNGTINASGTSRIDNIIITASPESFVAGYQNISVGTATSYVVSGLATATDYYYRVRAVHAAPSANSETILVRTNNDPVIWNGTTWSNIDGPDATTAAIIEGDYSTQSNGVFTANRLTVNSGTFTVNSATNISVVNNVISSGAENFIVESNANLLQQEDIENIGSITVVRNSAPMIRLDYTYWSSPVLDQNLYSFSPLTLPNRFYQINEPTNSFIAPTTSTFMAGKGYCIRSPNTFTTTPQTYVGTFTGIPNNGNVTQSATKTAIGANLLGNPYPSAISASLFLAANPGALYFWTHNSQNATSGANYASYTTLGSAAAAGGAVPNGVIAVGQGFVYMTANPRTAIFTNGMRMADNQNQFFRNTNNATSSAEGKHRIWLNLKNDDIMVNQTLVGYMEGATDAEDISIDGRVLETGHSSLYSLIAEEAFVIQGKGLPFSNSDTVTLGFNAASAGNYSIGIDHLDGIFSGAQDVFLKDNLTNTTVDLKLGDYSFVSAEGNYASRFEMVYQNATLDVDTAVNSEAFIVYQSQDKLHIQSSSALVETVTVYDVTGRVVCRQVGSNGALTTIDKLHPQNQLLIIAIATVDGGKVVKKVMF